MLSRSSLRQRIRKEPADAGLTPRDPRTAPENESADTLERTLMRSSPEHTFDQLPKLSDWDKNHAECPPE